MLDMVLVEVFRAWSYLLLGESTSMNSTKAENMLVNLGRLFPTIFRFHGIEGGSTTFSQSTGQTNSYLAIIIRGGGKNDVLRIYYLPGKMGFALSRFREHLPTQGESLISVIKEVRTILSQK
jgi:hypothetical protein